MAAAWAAFLDLPWDESTKLGRVSTEVGVTAPRNTVGDARLQCIDQKQLSDEDSGPLEVDSLPSVMAKVVDIQHGRVHQLRNVGEGPFKVGKERRVVERPFRGVLIVPVPEWQAVCDGKPVPVDFKVC